MTKDLVEHDCSILGKIYLNAFHGGEKGRCVQLTIPNGYAQMTFAEAKQFFKECLASIKDTEKQYDQKPPWWEIITKKMPPSKYSREPNIIRAAPCDHEPPTPRPKLKEQWKVDHHCGGDCEECPIWPCEDSFEQKET